MKNPRKDSPVEEQLEPIDKLVGEIVVLFVVALLVTMADADLKRAVVVPTPVPQPNTKRLRQAALWPASMLARMRRMLSAARPAKPA